MFFIFSTSSCRSISSGLFIFLCHVRVCLVWFIFLNRVLMQLFMYVSWFHLCLQGHIELIVRRDHMLEDSVTQFGNLKDEDFHKIWRCKYSPCPFSSLIFSSRLFSSLITSSLISSYTPTPLATCLTVSPGAITLLFSYNLSSLFL